MAKLLRVAIAVSADEVEQAIVAWELAGVRNSSVEYLIGEPTEEPWPGHDNRTERAEVAAYLEDGQWRGLEPGLRSRCRELVGAGVDIVVRRMPDRDWRTAWHDYFDLVRVPGRRTIVVRPPQIAYEAKPVDVVIDLTPGLAFGTGQHQSTRLCLRMLADTVGAVEGGERALDVGTGSGILAAAAAKLGAASVLATDVDPLAVDAARQTARRNGLRDVIDVREGSVPIGEMFDLITANLTADILQHLASDLASALRPGGTLIASGLIAAREREVVEAFERAGLQHRRTESEDEWRGLAMSRG